MSPLAKSAFFIALFGAGTIFSTTASAALIASEDFNYTDGALTNAANNGGTGWSGAWQTISSYSSTTVTSSQDTMGGSSGSFWNYRNLNTSFTGSPTDPLYFSASFTKTGSDNSYAIWLRLGAAGATGINPNGPAIGLANDQFSLRLAGAGGSEVSGDFGTYTAGQTVQIVGKLEFDVSGGNEMLTIWVNPTDVETSTVGANITGRDVGWYTPGVAEVGSFVLNTGSGAIDNVKIGTTWNDVVSVVPEPSSAVLAGLRLTLGGGHVRRRRS